MRFEALDQWIISEGPNKIADFDLKTFKTGGLGSVYIQDRKLLLGATFAVLLLLGSGAGLLYIFFGEFGRNDFDTVPIQKTLRVDAQCPAERVSASYVVNASRDTGYISVIFYGVGVPGREFPFHLCASLRVFTDEIGRGPLSIGNHHDFTHERRKPAVKYDQIAIVENGKTNWFSFDTSTITPDTAAFALNIPVDNLLSRNGPDTWALDLEIVSVFWDSKIVPNGILPYSLEVLTDQELIIDSVKPGLARTRPNPHAESSYTINLINEEGPDNGFGIVGIENDNQLNTVNRTRLQLTLRDPDYSVRRDVGILGLSTLFGIAITVLFETLLVLSVRQSLKAEIKSVNSTRFPQVESRSVIEPRKELKMGYPDLPASVKAMLANEGHRVHHHLWHFVRNEQNWNDLPQADRDSLTADGWAAPRFDQQPGSGIDFLGMHRQMIQMVNSALASAGDPNWTSVSGWSPIPFEDDNADWPVPDWQSVPPTWANPNLWQEFTQLANHARSDGRVGEMKTIASVFQDSSWLATMTLDELGIQMEWSIHGWMHMRWSGKPVDDAFSVDPDNDWLFLPWSSHVNKVFWKLHGWIDDRISDWEAATSQTADLSGAWAGPPPPPGMMMHMAEARLLSHLPPRKEVPMPMATRELIVEGLLRSRDRP